MKNLQWHGLKFQIQRLTLLYWNGNVWAKIEESKDASKKRASQAEGSAVASEIPGIFEKQQRGQNDQTRVSRKENNRK